MNHSTSPRIILFLLTLLTIVPGTSVAGDAVDSRLTFAVGDGNVLTGPDADANASPSLPNAIPTQGQRLFFDDYEGRDTPFDNLTHFVLYMHEPGYFEGVDTEAGLVLRARLLNERGVDLRDDGSYIKVTKTLGARELAITAFPISANRFRLGYSYDLSWGGSAIFPHSEAAPGLRVELNGPSASFFLGAKTGLGQVNMPDNTVEQDTLWGVLGGGSLDFSKELRFEVGGGFFHRGTIDKPDLLIREEGKVKVAPWQGFGGSAQITYHVGTDIGVPIDFRLLKNDPQAVSEQLQRVSYEDDISFTLQSEFSALGQTVQDINQPHTTTVQPALAADLSAQLKIRTMRFHALLVYRDLAYILYNVPSLTPFVDFPSGMRKEPEIFARVAFDYYIPDYYFTPGVALGVSRPANATGVPSLSSDSSPALGQQTLVIFDHDQFQPINPGESVEFVYAAKLTMKWQLSDAMNFLGDLSFSYDPNRRAFNQSSDGVVTYQSRSRQDPNIVGFNLMMQAKF